MYISPPETPPPTNNPNPPNLLLKDPSTRPHDRQNPKIHRQRCSG